MRKTRKEFVLTIAVAIAIACIMAALLLLPIATSVAHGQVETLIKFQNAKQLRDVLASTPQEGIKAIERTLNNADYGLQAATITAMLAEIERRALPKLSAKEKAVVAERIKQDMVYIGIAKESTAFTEIAAKEVEIQKEITDNAAAK